MHGGTIQTCAFLTALVGFHPLLAMSWGSDILVDSKRDKFWTWMTRYTAPARGYAAERLRRGV